MKSDVVQLGPIWSDVVISHTAENAIPVITSVFLLDLPVFTARDYGRLLQAPVNTVHGPCSRVACTQLSLNRYGTAPS